jgi:hypothetical protein
MNLVELGGRNKRAAMKIVGRRQSSLTFARKARSVRALQFTTVRPAAVCETIEHQLESWDILSMGLFRNAALPARLPLGTRSSREYVVSDASSNHDDNVQSLLI